VATTLRNNGVRTELSLEDRKLDKQIKYADKKGIPLIIIAGPDEIASQQVKLRRLTDGLERVVGFDQVVDAVRDLLS
jgi:histidyl-tRNA synthetase